MTQSMFRAACVAVSLILLASTRGDAVGQTPRSAGSFDRDYTLEATMLGYRGIGGEIDGIRNPTLWALREKRSASRSSTAS